MRSAKHTPAPKAAFIRRGGGLSGLLREDAGQVLPMVTIMMVVLIGLVGLTLDVGRAYYAQRQLQATTDAAALAAAQAMLNPSSTPSTIVGSDGMGGIAEAYSSASATTTPKVMAAGANQRAGLPGTTEFAQLQCYASLKLQGQPCVGGVPYNAVQVQQTTMLPTVIAWMFGKKNMTINALSTAAARGGPPKPSNIAVIIDTTLSEDETDSNCVNGSGQSQTEMQCSLNGLQILLNSLQPCGQNQTSCSAQNGVATNPFDQVALFTFPDVTAVTAYVDTSCTTNVPTANSINGYWTSAQLGAPYNSSNYSFALPYNGTNGNYPVFGWIGRSTAAAWTFPTPGATSYTPLTTYYATPTTNNTFGTATYQLTGFLSDYKTSDAATTLNPSSPLVIASGAVSGCGGMGPPNYEGFYSTYYAGALYAAQAALTAAHVGNPQAENVIIIISDGNANAPQTALDGKTPSMPSSGVTNPANGSGLYPSWNNQCQQAITAAQYATSQNTLVYSVAYGSEPNGPGNCPTDTGVYASPCNTMSSMASAPQFFYSDYLQSGSNSTCTSSQPVTSINAIFTSIANDLTEARLIPNNTQ